MFERVQKFISLVEDTGGAAKICGAGATRGDNAGAVLVVGKNKEALEIICNRYHYDMSPVEPAGAGLHLA